jgi:hypothetical protein
VKNLVARLYILHNPLTLSSKYRKNNLKYSKLGYILSLRRWEELYDMATGHILVTGIILSLEP